jgi:Protein of unknown function (DUF3179)
MTAKRIWAVAVPLIALLGVGSSFAGRYYTEARQARLLQGQAATRERVVETSTGGKPHYEPIQYRAKDSRPAIMEPTLVSADQAKLVDGTMGIGVSVNGDSRFYPLFVMQYHQIVNDRCGDKPVACSY